MLRITRFRFGRTLTLALALFSLSRLSFGQDAARQCSGKIQWPVHTRAQISSGAVHTPDACTPGNIIVDGVFEATNPATLDNPNWTESSTQFGSPLCSVAACGSGSGTAGPRGGTFWSWFGGTSLLETASLSQAVTFPTGATVTLNFYLWIGSVSAPLTDTLVVQVDGVTQTTFTEPSIAEADYSLRTINLSAFADGISHTVKFLYTHAIGATGNFSVDDVSLDVVCNVVLTATPAALSVDPPVATVQISGNGVLELNENAIIDPTWHNGGATAFSLTGSVANLTGPGAGLTFNIPDAAADYGTIANGASKDCLSGTPNCYTINVAGVRAAQPTHLDLTIDETVTPLGIALVNDTVLKTWTLHVGDSFTDATADGSSAIYYPSIETILHNNVTVGCDTGKFCPTASTLRQEMAVFLIKASGQTTSACMGIFNDVPCSSIYAPFIEKLSALGITGGCQSNPGFIPPVFCPEADVLRQEMAVFLTKTFGLVLYGP